jgi:hypothetical protein
MIGNDFYTLIHITAAAVQKIGMVRPKDRDAKVDDVGDIGADFILIRANVIK